MEEHAKEVAGLLRVLANENRLLILCFLTDHPMNVSQLAEQIPNITQSALSQHLSILKAHRILNSRKSGQNTTYYIEDERILQVLEILKDKYCK